MGRGASASRERMARWGLWRLVGSGHRSTRMRFWVQYSEGVSAPQCHADRHAASAVRGSGTGEVAKAEALVEATGGIFGPHAEITAKPAASGLRRSHAQIGEANFHAQFREPSCRGKADPAGTPGDHCGPSLCKCRMLWHAIAPIAGAGC